MERVCGIATIDLKERAGAVDFCKNTDWYKLFPPTSS